MWERWGFVSMLCKTAHVIACSVNYCHLELSLWSFFICQWIMLHIIIWWLRCTSNTTLAYWICQQILEFDVIAVCSPVMLCICMVIKCMLSIHILIHITNNNRDTEESVQCVILWMLYYHLYVMVILCDVMCKRWLMYDYQRSGYLSTISYISHSYNIFLPYNYRVLSHAFGQNTQKV